MSPIRVLLILAAALIGGLWGCEQGSYFDPNTKQLRSDNVGRVEAIGEDFRVYEFTPQSDTSRQCIFVAASQKGGVFCWKKGQ